MISQQQIDGLDSQSDWAHGNVVPFKPKPRPVPPMQYATSWLAGMYRDTVIFWNPPIKWLSSRVNWWPILGALSVVASWVLGALLYLLLQWLVS